MADRKARTHQKYLLLYTALRLHPLHKSLYECDHLVVETHIPGAHVHVFVIFVHS